MKKRNRLLWAFAAVLVISIVAFVIYMNLASASTPSNFYCGQWTPDRPAVYADQSWKQVGHYKYYLGSYLLGDEYSCIGVWDTVKGSWVYSKFCKYGDLRECQASLLGGNTYPYNYPSCPAGRQGSGDGCIPGCSFYLDHGYCTTELTKTYYAQGDAITIKWGYDAVFGDYLTPTQGLMYFVRASIAVYDPNNGVIYSTTSTQFSGSTCFTLPSDATLGLYSIVVSATYTPRQPGFSAGEFYEAAGHNTQFIVLTGTAGVVGTCSNPHTECVDNTCTSIPGDGANDYDCSSVGLLCGITHTECADNTCTSFPGAANNTCTTNSDCTPSPYSCTGTIPSNANLCDGDDTGLTEDTPRTLVLSCGAPKCEYTCYLGYVYDNGACRLAQCTDSIPSNADLCSGDDSGLSADTARTLVLSCGAPKCEYTCSLGYVYDNGACRLAQCTGSVQSNSQLCTGDDSGLAVDTSRKLVPTCTTGTKCEYVCNSGYEYDNGACVPIVGPQCVGAIPSNSQLCSGDSDGLAVDTPITLVPTCGAPKCEYYCSSGYVYDSGACRPFQCTGATPANSQVCSGEDTGLSADTARTLVSTCSSDINTKCEYYCSSGYKYQGGTCVPSINPTLTDAQWQNMLGEQITSAFDTNRVQMIVTGSNLANQPITFDWYRQELGLFGCDPCVADTHLDSTTVKAVVDDYASYNILLNATYDGDVYFTASVASSTITSGMMTVSPPGPHCLPVAVITSPTDSGIYLTSTPVTFSQASYSECSNIAGYKWDFGDGSTSTAASDTHSYSSDGEKTINLTVTDDQGATASAQVSILLIGIGSNVYSFIEKPEAGSALVTNCLNGDSSCLKVDYSGTQSYAVDVTNSKGTISISCIAGACPSQTSTTPPIIITNTPQGYNNLFFNWTFGDAGMIPDTGYGRTGDTVQFASTGDKIISLEVSYGNQKALTSNGFKLFDQHQCSNDGYTWYDIENNKIVGTEDTRDQGVCAGADGQPGTGDDCCPSGETCSTSSDGTVGCVIIPPGNCSAYTTQVSCGDDPNEWVKDDILWQYFPCEQTVDGYAWHCFCSWDSNKCVFSYTKTCTLPSTCGPSPPACNYNYDTSECSNGYQSVTIHLLPGSDPTCTDDGKVVSLPCGRPVIELPFADARTIAVAVIVIIAIYILIRVYSGKKKSGRRRR